MIFEHKNPIERIGEKVGFVFSYFLFTTILFFILTVLNKIPSTWTYFHVMGITLLITLIGNLVKRFLK